jgi:hypothetical protein
MSRGADVARAYPWSGGLDHREAPHYAVYGSLQAWIATNGMTGTADDHMATLRTIARQIEQRNLFPEPWNLLAVGCPMRGDRLYLNDNGRNVADHVEVLSIPIRSVRTRTSGPGSARGCAARARRG